MPPPALRCEAPRSARRPTRGTSSPTFPYWGPAVLFPLCPGRAQNASLEEELAELPGQLADYRRELASTPAEDKTRREWLEWHIRRVQKRMADVEARLAKVSAESGQ